ncbi:MAG: class I SAM-dependent methyltransferase [Bacteroidota bacterium]
MSFKDHFSRQSDIYAQSRPGYPPELFHFLASLVKQNELAWDCGTGNGQAAVSLAGQFREVIATDASGAQINHAFKKENVRYKVAASENSGLEDHSADLVTAAAAIHWFDLPKFYAEVRRVLKPGGIMAAWTYSDVDNPELGSAVNRLAFDVLKDHWPPESRLVWNKYKDLPFPFEEIKAPSFECSVRWDLQRFLAYLSSWSSAQRYINAHGSNPLEQIIPDLKKVWPDEEKEKKIRMTLALRVGRLPDADPN